MFSTYPEKRWRHLPVFSLFIYMYLPFGQIQDQQKCVKMRQLRCQYYQSSGGFTGAPRRAPSPHGPKFSQFHAVFRKIWQNRVLAPPRGGLALPPMGNPGSAPAKCDLDLCRQKTCSYETPDEFLIFTS